MTRRLNQNCDTEPCWPPRIPTIKAAMIHWRLVRRESYRNSCRVAMPWKRCFADVVNHDRLAAMVLWFMWQKAYGTPQPR